MIERQSKRVYWIKPTFGLCGGEEVLRNSMDFDFQVKLEKAVI